MSLPIDKETIKYAAKILENPLLWAETHLVVPSTGEKFKANYVEKQILESKSPRVVIRVARRSGKTFSLSILALWACIVNKYYDVLVLAPDEGQVTELFEVIREFIEANPTIQDSIVANSKNPNFISFKNGSTIKGKTAGSSSNKEGRSIRGKGANLIIVDEAAYLNDNDWKAISAIIAGDKYKEGVRAFVASTPNSLHNRYWELCNDSTGMWEQIHVPITKNPDFTEEDIALRRAMSSDVEWCLEQLAEFLDVGQNAFKNSDIDAAMADYRYLEEPTDAGLNKRVIGVDWDKYSSGVNIAIVDSIYGTNKLRLVYREEVPRGEYTLTESIKRIIAINEAYNPDYIYVDRGFGETQVELLKLYGKEHPSSGLDKKLIGVAFKQNVEVVDPIDGTINKKQFKAVMLNNMMRLFEDKRFEFSKYDKQYEKQLRNYQILSVSADSIQTSRKNEHIIDAVGLACYGIYKHFNDPLQFKPANKVVVLPPLKVVKTERTREIERQYFKKMQSAVKEEQRSFASIARGNLGSGTLTRSKF